MVNKINPSKIKLKSVVIFYGIVGIGFFIYNQISPLYQNTPTKKDTVYVYIDTSDYELIGTKDETGVIYTGPIAGSQDGYNGSDTVYVIRYIEEEQFTKDTGEHYMGN